MPCGHEMVRRQSVYHFVFLRNYLNKIAIQLQTIITKRLLKMDP